MIKKKSRLFGGGEGIHWESREGEGKELRDEDQPAESDGLGSARRKQCLLLELRIIQVSQLSSCTLEAMIVDTDFLSFPSL